MSPRYGLAALDLDGTALGADPERFAPGLLEAAAAAARDRKSTRLNSSHWS